MKTLATVVEIENEKTATVSVARHAACDGCHKNADGTGCSVCTLLGGKREARARALNTAGAAVGDTVEVESRTGRMLLYAATVFLLPVLLALGAYFIGLHLTAREGVALASCAAAFVISFVGVWLFSRLVTARRLDVEIVRVVAQNTSHPPKG
ncbi:MAG: SoxR reducing system RseC family protein [Clostridia bacterium]|nr:SoxR reducing system RseC family protein [Clostridia bacterium]